MPPLTSVEICAGAGGQALGLEMAGFEHKAAVEYDAWACKTLRLNRPEWNVIEGDLLEWDGKPYKGVDLLAGGVPCPPFSVAGKQLGHEDERDLFPTAMRLVEEIEPRAVMLENVRGLQDPKFDAYRESINQTLRDLGYAPEWKLLQASDYGVSQLRPRFIMVAMRADHVPASSMIFADRMPDVGEPAVVQSGAQKSASFVVIRAARASNSGADSAINSGVKRNDGPETFSIATTRPSASMPAEIPHSPSANSSTTIA